MDVSFIDLLREFGVLLTLVVFFTWQGWKREQRLSDRIKALEEDYTSALKELVVSCTEVIASNTCTMQRLEKQLIRLEHLQSKSDV